MEHALTFSPAGAAFGKPPMPTVRPRPVAPPCAPRRHGPGFALAVVVAAVAIAAVLALGAKTPQSRAAAPVADAAAVFTGEYVGDVPVYRLPPVHVVASRSAGLSRTAGEDAARVSATRP